MKASELTIDIADWLREWIDGDDPVVRVDRSHSDNKLYVVFESDDRVLIEVQDR